MEKPDEKFHPVRVAPGVVVRVIPDRWGEEGTPFSGGSLVTVIEIRDDATHERGRRALKQALDTRDRLRREQGYHGANGLVELALAQYQRYHRSPKRPRKRLLTAQAEAAMRRQVQVGDKRYKAFQRERSFGITYDSLADQVNEQLKAATRVWLNGDRAGKVEVTAILEAWLPVTAVGNAFQEVVDVVRAGLPLEIVTKARIQEAFRNCEHRKKASGPQALHRRLAHLRTSSAFRGIRLTETDLAEADAEIERVEAETKRCLPGATNDPE